MQKLNGLKGEYWDLLSNAKGELHDFGWRGNVIVNQCRQLLAGFMKGDPVSNGIQSIALGRGEAAWDIDMPEAPDMTVDSLTDPAPESVLISDAAMEIDYLDSTGNVTSDPSHLIQVSVTLAPGSLPIAAGETTFPLREFALFGALGSDSYMIDYVRHPVMNIGPEDTLVRRIRLIF